MEWITPSESNDESADSVCINAYQFGHFVGAGFHSVLHRNPPSIHGFIAPRGAGSSLSEVATCLEQLVQGQVKKRHDRNGKRRHRWMRNSRGKLTPSATVASVRLWHDETPFSRNIIPRDSRPKINCRQSSGVEIRWLWRPQHMIHISPINPFSDPVMPFVEASAALTSLLFYYVTYLYMRQVNKRVTWL